MAGAFQFGAFQFTGFQEQGIGVGSGGWFWPSMLLSMKRAYEKKKKREADEEEKKRKEQEEMARVFVPLRFVLVAPDPIRAPAPRTFLKRLLPNAERLINDAAELAEFKDLMRFVAMLDPESLSKAKRMRRVVSEKPAHERPKVVALQDKMEATFAAFFAAQVPKIAHQIEVLRAKVGKAQRSDDEQDALDQIVAGIDFAGWSTLTGDISDDMLDAVKDGGYDALRVLGLDVTADREVYNAVNEDAVRYAAKRSADLVTEIEEPTRDMIRGLVGDALDEGWSTDTLAGKLLEGAAFSPARAQTIARTEIIRASNQGTLTGFVASGVVSKKEWTTFDPCPICEENEDQGPIDLDEDFASGDDAPPAHPNCKCALVGYSEADVPQEAEEQ
jgi:hypothetical protein